MLARIRKRRATNRCKKPSASQWSEQVHLNRTNQRQNSIGSQAGALPPPRARRGSYMRANHFDVCSESGKGQLDREAKRAGKIAGRTPRDAKTSRSGLIAWYLISLLLVKEITHGSSCLTCISRFLLSPGLMMMSPSTLTIGFKKASGWNNMALCSRYEWNTSHLYRNAALSDQGG